MKSNRRTSEIGLVEVFGSFQWGEIDLEKAINTRELQVLHPIALEYLSGRQTVFIDITVSMRLSEILASSKKSSALAGGQVWGSAQCGETSQSDLERKKMRSSIDVDAVQRPRLTSNSKLLALAKIVYDGDHLMGG